MALALALSAVVPIPQCSLWEAGPLVVLRVTGRQMAEGRGCCAEVSVAVGGRVEDLMGL